MKFKVVKGMHVQNGKVYTKGKTIESEQNLVEKYVGKFVRVAGRNEDEVESEEAATPAPGPVAALGSPTAPSDTAKSPQIASPAPKGKAKGKVKKAKEAVVESEDEWSKERDLATANG